MADGIDTVGPFVASISRTNNVTNVPRKSYRLFESMEAARLFVWAGATMVAEQPGFTIISTRPESLHYETDPRQNEKVFVSVAFDPDQAREVLDARG